jgi:arginase family enzyme
LVDLAPIAYPNTRYEGKLGVLWVDSHPDVTAPKAYPNAHVHVLGALCSFEPIGIKVDFSGQLHSAFRPDLR